MDIKEVRDRARKNLKGFCSVCKVCNGIACAGEVPGMGGSGTGSTFKANVEDLARVTLNLRCLHNSKNPDTSFKFFTEKLSMPIISAPITGTKFNMGGYLSEKEYIDAVVGGSIRAGSLAMIGDSALPSLYTTGLDSLKEVNSKGIAIVKPRENQKVMENIKLAEEINLPAIGMDIDGAGLITMALSGAPVGPKNIHELKEIIGSSNLPFILKGIMTIDEAIIAMECGASAIVISNHGGRVLDHCQSTAKVVSEISQAVKGRMTILVDGGIRSGVDVFKMLALGADGVLIGRPLVTGAFGAREEGVSLILETMKKELYQTMILTGAKDLASINKTMINVPW